MDLSGNRTLLKWLQKVMVCDLLLADFNPFCVFLFLRFIACDGKSVIMIEGSKKRNCEGGF